MSLDRKYLVWALCYVVIGMGLGIFMAASGNHAEKVTHAHILLVGFVVSFIYAVIHKLWLGPAATGMGKVQFILHQVGAVPMFIGLFLVYGNFVAEATLEPVLAMSSNVVLLAAVLMTYMVIRAKPTTAT